MFVYAVCKIEKGKGIYKISDKIKVVRCNIEADLIKDKRPECPLHMISDKSFDALLIENC